jgi:hypothetical protein
LRIHESESGVEVESSGIIDALWADVAPEIAQCHIVGREPQRRIDEIGVRTRGPLKCLFADMSRAR